MSIKNIPSFQRPREKLRERGPEALSDTELLAVLLRTGTHKKNVLDLAQSVLPTGSIQDLADKTHEDLCGIKGIGSAGASVILCAREYAKRIYSHKQDTSVETAKDVLHIVSGIRNKKKEYFTALFLNARYQLINYQIISIGSVDTSIAHPREVFAPALACGAVYIIVAHNHPSGDPEPSKADLLITHRLIEAGKILGVSVLDHIILGGDTYKSLKEDGLI